MKTGAGLALIAVGAILAFAVNATPSWLNLHIGRLGAHARRPGRAWCSHAHLRLARPPDPDPADATPPAGSGRRSTPPARRAARIEAGTAPQPTFVDQDDVIDGTTLNGEPQGTYRTVNGQTEVIEDLYEQP